MKKILAILLVIMMALPLAACGSDGAAANDGQASGNIDVDSGSTKQEETDSGSAKQEETKEKVKSDGYDKFSQLRIGMTEDEVNAILGEPTRVDKAYYYYNITVNGNDLELEVWINTVSGFVTYLSGDFSSSEYRAEFTDSATDLSTVNGLESGEINTYDDCVSAFKTSGYLMNINEDGVKQYLWVNVDDGYMRVTFKADGSVKTYSGYC